MRGTGWHSVTGNPIPFPIHYMFTIHLMTERHSIYPTINVITLALVGSNETFLCIWVGAMFVLTNVPSNDGQTTVWAQNEQLVVISELSWWCRAQLNNYENDLKLCLGSCMMSLTWDMSKEQLIQNVISVPVILLTFYLNKITWVCLVRRIFAISGIGIWICNVERGVSYPHICVTMCPM